METDDTPIGRILTRREAIRMAALTGAGLAVASLFDQYAIAAPTTQPRLPMIASPVMTEGPFFRDNKLNRIDLVNVTKRPSVIDATPLLLSFAVYKLDGSNYAPIKDLQIDIWESDAIGVYSGEADRINRENTTAEDWLRGCQTTDADGVATFKTIVPGWYQGRTPHIHFKVRQFDPEKNVTSDFTSQLFFHEPDLDKIFTKPPYLPGPRSVTNARDGIFNAKQPDGTLAGSYLLLDLTEDADSKGYKSHFDIVLADGNMHKPTRPYRGA